LSATKDEEFEREYARIGDEKSPLVVKVTSFQGSRYLDLRRYYFDKKSKETRPTPKGIALKEDEFKEVVSVLEKNAKAILSDFADDLNAVELVSRGQRREVMARKSQKSQSECSEILFERWPGTMFLRVESLGKTFTLRLNTNNKFVAQLEKGGDSLLALFRIFLQSYVIAKHGLDFSRKVDAESFTTFLEMEWSNVLHSIQNASGK
jgi:hypothetical protein